MATSTCDNCNKPIKQFFPLDWCHWDGKDTIVISCYPDAKEGTPEYNMVATPKIESEHVYDIRCTKSRCRMRFRDEKGTWSKYQEFPPDLMLRFSTMMVADAIISKANGGKQ